MDASAPILAAWPWCLASGASGYLLKEDGVDDAARAIQAAAVGSIVLTRSASTLLGGEELGCMSLARVRELEEQVRDIESQMAEGTNAKSQFLANVSHELRTPVTVAKGIAHVLRNPNVSEEERGEFLEQLQASLDKLAGLVNEIIEITELDQGTFELNIAYTDLAPLIDRAVADMGDLHPSVLVTLPYPREPVRVWPTRRGSTASSTSSWRTRAATRPTIARSRSARASWTRASSSR